MASDKPVSNNHVLRTNVKIKVEPDTSMPMSIRNIKTEPGLTSSTTRLTSFRIPRDLTLGGNIKTEKPKKVYVPNVNVQRKKNKDDAVPVKNEPGKPQRGRERGRGRGRGERGRGRNQSNVIQSTGSVFSGEVSPSVATRSWSRGSRESSGDASSVQAIEKPKLNLNYTVNKAEEEEKLKALLRDDFIDDGVEQDVDYPPVLLPLIEEGKLNKDQKKVETTVESDIEDVKPTILENGEALVPKKEVKVKKHVSDPVKKKQLPETITQVMEKKSNNYILIQFPDCLPGLESSSDDQQPKQSSDKNEPKNNEDNIKDYCTLRNLKGGMLGKLQILKSGKARLQLGDNSLIVDVGSNISFRQDLLAAKVDTVKLDGDLINLGPVSSTLICSPDWESMLAKL